MTRTASRIAFPMAFWVLIAAPLVAAGPRPARADNPKVAVKVQDVPLGEALKKLTEATGIPIDLSAGHLAAERVTFDWSSATLGRALRDLCARFNLQPNRNGSRYMLYLTGGAPAGKPVGVVQKNGVHLSVRSASVNENRHVNFAGAGASYSNSSLNLQVAAEIPNGDGDTVAGLDNVVARDDQGNTLQSPNQSGSHYGGYSNQFPDEWVGSLHLGSPHPKAKKLQWVEGDLMVYKHVKQHRAEIPLPLPARSFRREVGSLLIVASRFQVIPKAEDEGDEADLPGPRFARQNQDFGHSVRIRVFTPVGARFSSRAGGWGLPPVAVGESGKTYPGSTFRGGGSSSDGQWQVSDTTWIFPGMAENPVKLVWEIVEKSEPVKLFSFRMSDIPLPDAAVVVPRVAGPAPAPRPAARPEAEHPFYQKGGGTLVGSVAVANQPVQQGVVQLGLAARTATGWGPIRWTEVVIGPDGKVRLEEIRPGAYRVLRKYRGDAAVRPGGHWQSYEVRVQVAAGKEHALPVLRWNAGPAPATSGAGAKPAPRKKK